MILCRGEQQPPAQQDEALDIRHSAVQASFLLWKESTWSCSSTMAGLEPSAGIYGEARDTLAAPDCWSGALTLPQASLQ